MGWQKAGTSQALVASFPKRKRPHTCWSCSTPLICAGPPRPTILRRILRRLAFRRSDGALPLWRLQALQTANLSQGEGKEETGRGEEEGHVSIGELLRFTAPTLGIWMINPVLSLVDTSVVGTRSAIQLAALGPGTSLCDSLAYVCTFLATATTNMLALSLARRDRQQVVATLSDALVISGIMGIGVAVLLYAAAPAAVRMFAGSASSAVIPPAVEYVRWRAWGMPAALLIFVGQAYFLAARDPVTPLLVAVFAGCFNLCGDLLLCNVFDLGIAGASAATSFAQVVAAGALFWSLGRPLREGALMPGFVPELRLRMPSLKAVRVFLSFAGPVCGVLLSKVLMYGSLTAVATKLGPEFVGAHHITITTFAFFATVGDAVSTGAQAFLPDVVGQPKLAKRMAKDIMRAGVFIGLANSCLASAVLWLGRPAFTNSVAVLGVTGALLPGLATALCVHTCSMASEGLLLAGRDLNFLVRSYIGNLVLALTALALTQRARLGILGVWWVLVQFQTTRLVWNTLRLRNAGSPLRATQPLRALAH